MSRKKDAGKQVSAVLLWSTLVELAEATLADDGNAEGMAELRLAGDSCLEEGLRVEDWLSSAAKRACTAAHSSAVG
jgi:hypothetical protein